MTPDRYTSVADTDQTIRLTSGRTIGFADYGRPGDTAVIWRHGSPGSRLAPASTAGAAGAAGLRLVGIDRPGYGLSTVEPGRTIGGWVPDAFAVADHLGIDRFVTVGTSTGGAFALAVAALAPERVLGVVACCATTHMRWKPARATMSRPHAHAVWDAPDREAAMAAAVQSHGLDGSKILESAEGPPLAPSDLAMMTGHPWGRHWLAAVPAMFAQGLAGYTDDRLADGPSWVTFDIADNTSPVIVLHGARNAICDPLYARHTAAIVPHTELRIIDDLGHLSIEDQIVPTIIDLLARAT